MARCLYSDTFENFLNVHHGIVLSQLCNNYHGEILTTTKDARNSEIEMLQRALKPWEKEKAQIIFEYNIPRLGKRIDVVLLLRGIIFCLEFKVGQRDALQADVEQVMDYALDLKNFHLFSHDKKIVPILIPTEYKSSSTEFKVSAYDDGIYNPLITGNEGFQKLLEKVLEHAKAPVNAGIIDDWLISPYSPTPTIIEAARTLYENHSVEDITRHEADKVSTDQTINYILDVIEKSKSEKVKSICLVTGVPGAGKTLVGLDIAIKQTYKNGVKDKENGAVYLSGNGPLVAVLKEALARDNWLKCKEKGKKKKLTDLQREVSEFIQVIHNYRDNMLAKIKNPVENGVVEIDPSLAVKQNGTGYSEVEHVAIFDEAQRCWTKKRIANYLKRGGTYGNKLKVPNFPMSEAEFLIWSLDQCEDWAVIVCLVGGGQEINTGEAGISEWIDALNNKFKHWHVHISNKLTETEYADGKTTEKIAVNPNAHFSEKLHLAVSLRSFRAETLSCFIHSLLAFNPNAKNLYQDIENRKYPIILTRDMDVARQWLRKKVRGNEHSGILVTKVAARFKPLAVNVLAQGDENAIHWFLEDKTDIRSSNYLEDAATEIQVQGLELDFACVLWDADIRCESGKWTYHKFNGKDKWLPEKNKESQKYMLNAYRVLLTRARQGLIICVPKGNSNKTPESFPEDPTRLPEFYDGTYRYLKSLGLTEIK